MLNEVLYSKYENEVLGKQISYPAKVKKALDKKYASFFGDGKWKTSIYDQGNRSDTGGKPCGHRLSTGFWNDGILLSALLSEGMHIHDHGGYLPEHTFPVWVK